MGQGQHLEGPGSQHVPWGRGCPTAPLFVTLHGGPGPAGARRSRGRELKARGGWGGSGPPRVAPGPAPSTPPAGPRRALRAQPPAPTAPPPAGAPRVSAGFVPPLPHYMSRQPRPRPASSGRLQSHGQARR